MENMIKTKFIKIAKRLYEDGVPLSSGYSSVKTPIFDGLFEITYADPHIEDDGTIRLSCLGDVSAVKYKADKVNVTNRIAGELYQGVVGGVFLPTDDFIHSIEKNIGEYLSRTAGINDRSKIDSIIDRLIEDIINNVPVKSIYKTVKHKRPGEFAKILSLYKQRNKRDIFQDLENLVYLQGQYNFELNASYSGFIKISQSQDRNFKQGTYVELKPDLRGQLQEYEALGKQTKESEASIKRLREMFDALKKRNLAEDKVFVFIQDHPKDKNYAIVAGKTELGGIDQVAIYKAYLVRSRKEKSSKYAGIANKLQIDMVDMRQLQDIEQSSRIHLPVLFSLLAEAIENNKVTYNKKGEKKYVDIDSFVTYVSSNKNFEDRAAKAGMHPDDYYENMYKAGENGMSVGQFLKEQKTAKDKKTEDTIKKEQDAAEAADRQELEKAKELSSAEEQASRAGLREDLIDMNIDPDAVSDLMAAVRFRKPLLDMYKKMSASDKENLPKSFLSILDSLSSRDKYAAAVFRYFDIPEEVFKDENVLLKHYNQIVEVIKNMQANKHLKDQIPEKLLWLYNMGLPKMGDRILGIALENSGVSTDVILSGKKVDMDMAEKIKEAYDFAKQELPGYINRRVEKIISSQKKA